MLIWVFEGRRNMKTLTELVKDNKVRFTHARKGNLWYVTENEQFEFPVPFADMADATFNSEDKAMFFMRWIRRHLNDVEGEMLANGKRDNEK